MANYIHCPRDLKKINKKWFWKFTKRQTICFGLGLFLGFISYITTYKHIGTTFAVVLLMAVAAPFIICGLYNKQGLHLEDVVRNRIDFMQSKNDLIYKSSNFYVSLLQQAEIFKIKNQLKRAGESIPKKKIKKERKIKNDEIKF